jgi:L-threonylcarbamoyladenylate synthase
MENELKKQILEGRIFIYPTDTIYGLGCNALDEKAVQKIREIKNRDMKPISFIAPNLDWIKENLIVNLDLEKYLPGPYTLVLKKKDKNFLNWVSSGESLGVRIPANKFCDEVRSTGIPFITTSVNLAGEKPANKIAEISTEIIKKVDIVIDEGELSGKPSTLIVNGKEIERN